MNGHCLCDCSRILSLYQAAGCEPLSDAFPVHDPSAIRRKAVFTKNLPPQAREMNLVKIMTCVS